MMLSNRYSLWGMSEDRLLPRAIGLSPQQCDDNSTTAHSRAAVLQLAPTGADGTAAMSANGRYGKSRLPVSLRSITPAPSGFFYARPLRSAIQDDTWS
jgi:hypothetical protein